MELIATSKELEISRNSLQSLVTTIENFIYDESFNPQTLQVVLDKTKGKRVAETDSMVKCHIEEFWFEE